MPLKAALAAIVLCLGSARLYAQSCAGLAKLTSAMAVVTLTASIDSGSFSPSVGSVSLGRLPAFCRVAATLKPTADSEIHVEVWLPVSGWNGKFLAVGSGGWGGSLASDAMAEGLRRGYATAATDDGHTGPSASFVVGHPRKFIDFAYRAEREMAVEAKRLIQTFYGRAARYSYWNGCSGGGREGLLQAARYPDEFDGIIAGDPADMRRNAWALWLANQSFKDPAAYIPPAKYPLIHHAVLEACDASDGLEDGLLEEPEACHPDLKPLTCKGADGAACLTARQVQTAETILSPARDAQGNVLFPRLEPGTELRWGRLAGGPAPADLFLDQFRFVVYKDAQWDWRTFNLDRDAARARAENQGIDDLNPDLAAYARHGGKLLLYHGWADQQVAPGSTVDFYNAVVAHSPGPASDWLRLYMVPGMGHCSGGEGPDTFDKIGVLEQWVEHGKPPASIVASHQTAGRIDRTRPLCPYPATARYNGTGSIDAAENFTCTSSRSPAHEAASR